jgi:parvulin-like peptidyl-prolyl isomerase
MKQVSLFTLLTILSLIFGLSCGSTPDTVAVIEGERIPMELIENYYERLGTTFSTAEAEYEAKRMALDSLIDYKLLVKAAYDRGLDMDNEIEKIVTSQRSKFLFDELYRQDILPHTEVSEREVMEFLEKTRTEYRFSHILVRSREQADSLYRELQQGADFADLARVHSLDQSSAVKGGDIGFINWGRQTNTSFREAAFALEIGGISEPVQTDAGWHIIRMEESRPADLPSSGDEIEFFAREIIRQRKSQEAETVFWEKMEDKANVRINEEATALLLEKLRTFYPDTIGGAPRPDNYFPNVELLQPYEREMLLASYTGGELTIEGYLSKIGNVQEFHRPKFADPDSLAKIIFQLELNNIGEFEADQRRLYNTPEYQRRLRDFREGVMVEKLRRDHIGRDITVDEDEIVEYYNSHVGEFKTDPEFHLLEIEHDSVELLKTLIREANLGADFAELAAQYTIRPGFKEKGGDLGMVPTFKYPYLYAAARNMEIGDISPVVTNARGNNSIVKLIDVKQAQVRPLEDCADEVRQRILRLRRDNALGDWLQQTRAEADIQIFEEVIRNSIDESEYESG